MLRYIAYRILLMIPTIFVISLISFLIIQLPPGDFLTSYVAGIRARGEEIDEATIQALRNAYGLGEPMHVQYLKWISGVLRGDFGQSFTWNVAVSNLIWDRVWLTVAVSLITLIFTWVVAFPIGVYSAVRPYSMLDYLFTFFGFIGVAVPSFLLALILLVVAFKFGMSVGGLFSPGYEEAPWSWAKVVDLLQHIWIPVIVLGLSGTASLIRVMRANLLDELHKPYVTTARLKGQKESVLLLRYPVRAALNPFVSTLGWTLPQLVSGSTIVAVVLSLPLTGPMMLQALVSQDMYLAGSFILILSVLTVIGTLLSDILLAWLDPRIRLERTG
ncbi:MAG TPA: ABC transporter permease [Caldilineaceae bacterium]|nr:ABC transporter permease [Caldilineaceae bacterium]